MHIFTALYADHWFSAFIFIGFIILGLIGFVDIFCNGLNSEDAKRRRGNIILAEVLCFYGLMGLLVLALWNNHRIAFGVGAILAISLGALVEFVRVRRRGQDQEASV